MRSLILVIHICAGVVGLLSGVGAVSFRKGSRRHRVVGNVFFGAMLGTATSSAIGLKCEMFAECRLAAGRGMFS